VQLFQKLYPDGASDTGGIKTSLSRHLPVPEVCHFGILAYFGVAILPLHARVVVHFHPDRLCSSRTTVAQALLKEGVYRNQFETYL
jgi:Protein of unknown function (DUF3626)